MGRRKERAAMQSTWSVYEARERGVPFLAGQLDDATEIQLATEQRLLRFVPSCLAELPPVAVTFSPRTYLPALARVAR